jgi:hypothetical protein
MSTSCAIKGYLDLWADREGWIVRDKQTAAQVFARLLKAGIFDEALLRPTSRLTKRSLIRHRLPPGTCCCFSAPSVLADESVHDGAAALALHHPSIRAVEGWNSDCARRLD